MSRMALPDHLNRPSAPARCTFAAMARIDAIAYDEARGPS